MIPDRAISVLLALGLLVIGFAPAAAAAAVCESATAYDEACASYGRGHACVSWTGQGDVGYSTVIANCVEVASGTLVCDETVVALGGAAPLPLVDGESCVATSGDLSGNGICIHGWGQYGATQWTTDGGVCVLEPIPL